MGPQSGDAGAEDAERQVAQEHVDVARLHGCRPRVGRSYRSRQIQAILKKEATSVPLHLRS